MSKISTQVLIIGSGPAGLSAGIYTSRAALKTILLEGIEPGGQLTTTTDVENYPGFEQAIQGTELISAMMNQAKNVGTTIIADHIKEINLQKKPFLAKSVNNNYYEADAVIICTGAQAKWLGLKSEEFFKGFGVSGCATCDGFFFKNKEVIVIGGGNTAVEEALYLTKFAKQVTLIHRKDTLKAEKILQQRLCDNKKIKILWNTAIQDILGETNPRSVTGVNIINTLNNNTSTISCDGVFIAIGHKPNTDLVKNQISLDKDGYIITAPNSTKTSIPGVFAAGDVQDKIFRQAITAAGSGCMAALEVEKFLHK